MTLDAILPYPACIGVVHLGALPGAPGYNGDFTSLRAQALREALIYEKAGLSGLIVENFGDAPFFKDNVPPETIAAIAVVTSDIVREISIPVGVNILRNDACAALAVAASAGASFIRVNIHSHAALTDQGIIEGRAAQSLRMRARLNPDIKILADLRVKHAAPLAEISLSDEIRDLEERGMADGLILTGRGTGQSVDPSELSKAAGTARNPLFVGSGVNANNVKELASHAQGFIVGSAFKQGRSAKNPVDAKFVEEFMSHVKQIQ